MEEGVIFGVLAPAVSVTAQASPTDTAVTTILCISRLLPMDCPDDRIGRYRCAIERLRSVPSAGVPGPGAPRGQLPPGPGSARRTEAAFAPRDPAVEREPRHLRRSTRRRSLLRGGSRHRRDTG